MTEKSIENLPSPAYSTYTSNEPRQWLMASINCRHVDMKRLLGLNPKLVDWKTAMHYAAKFGNLRCAKLLIRYRANVNALSRGQTPLHLAVLHAQAVIIKFLVEQCGADTSVMDFTGHLPVSFFDDRLPPDFYGLLTAGRIQRIRDALKLLQPSANPPRHHYTLKLMNGHGLEFKRPLLPSKSVLQHRNNSSTSENGPQQSVKRVASSASSMPPPAPLSPAYAAGTSAVDSGGDCDRTLSNGDADRPNGSTVPGKPAVGRRISSWMSILQATAAAATASAHHKTVSRASLAWLPSTKLTRSVSALSAYTSNRSGGLVKNGRNTISSCSSASSSSTSRRNMPVSVSSAGCLPLKIHRHSENCPPSSTSIPRHLLPKHIPPDADLNLLSSLLALLPPASEPESPPRSKSGSTLKRGRKFFSRSSGWWSLDGSGDHAASRTGGARESAHRSPSCYSLSLSRGAGGGTSMLRSQIQRRSNSMSYPASPLHNNNNSLLRSPNSNWSSESQLSTNAAPVQ